MRVGYQRLQAVVRSRVLSHRFRHLRGHIVALQARARGYLLRREVRAKRWAIIKIQAHVRRMIAQRRYRKLQYEYSQRREAQRLFREEEFQLKQQGVPNATELARRNYKVFKQNMTVLSSPKSIFN